MENASKALLMAGGFLIAILVISLCMYVFSTAKGTMMTVEERRIAQLKEEQTIKFMNYVGNNIYGSEVVNCVRRAMNYNVINPTNPIEVKYVLGGSTYTFTNLGNSIGSGILDTSNRNILFRGRVTTRTDGTIETIVFTKMP